MNDAFTIVFDTNTLISAAILRNSIPAKVFDLSIYKHNAIHSFQTLMEVTEVFARKKFDKYITLDEKKFFLNNYIQNSFEIVTSSIITDCRDPKDNKFLELAVDGNADYIITGDDDLLTLHPYHNISIVTPAQFLTILTEEK